ncbi:MAG: hypothetical protein H6R00_1383 [Proteobacteria bacterium]|nr:hypothetical protein [Pseudomonadota bacterium]
MTSRKEPELSVEEHISYLKKSSLPTVIVEGKDDIVVYRVIEKIYGPTNISVLPVGGREAVIGIFKRRSEIDNDLFFIADKDMWCLTGVPGDFSDVQICLTHGYSLENDVIIDGNILSYMNENEKEQFEKELSVFLEWYIITLDRHLRSKDKKIQTHPEVILSNIENIEDLIRLEPDEIYPVELKSKILADPMNLVRGKSLFAVLIRQLSYKGRYARHNCLSLMEVVANSRGDRLNRIFGSVRDYFHLGQENTVV